MQMLIKRWIPFSSICMQSQPGLIQVNKPPRASNSDTSDGRQNNNKHSTEATNAQQSQQCQLLTPKGDHRCLGTLSGQNMAIAESMTLRHQKRVGGVEKKQDQCDYGLN